MQISKWRSHADTLICLRLIYLFEFVEFFYLCNVVYIIVDIVIVYIIIIIFINLIKKICLSLFKVYLKLVEGGK